ncbi:uncharacterized protein LOC130154097 [Falco biarmicus]|uniref:uncharacterized protein LOC114016859 n=1 Tax=Falco cherrug TaxID=345164 RepID=UPI000FFB1C1C|nr:uncharacterized protein LOC114016859 [Falco cherrug]XP_037254060.1 uncharacterized protein LOC119152624 [Falco rusticolus]XP_056205817.1 uncharacterized protein LOC130154097 [Falco biarmicus]
MIGPHPQPLQPHDMPRDDSRCLPSRTVPPHAALRQEAIGHFRRLSGIAPGRFPATYLGRPQGAQSSSAAQLGERTAFSQEPCSALTFPGEYCCVRLSCVGTYLLSPSLLLESHTLFMRVLLAARTALGSRHSLCPQAPSDTSPCVPRYAGALQHLSDGSFISRLVFCTRSHLGALPVTLLGRMSFSPCPHAQSSMLNYLPLLPLGITKALTQWDCLC